MISSCIFASILSDISFGDCFLKKKRGKYRNLMLLPSIIFLIDKPQVITLAFLYFFVSNIMMKNILFIVGLSNTY